MPNEIKPEMVPTCVAEKLRRMVYDFETNERVLIAAALNAWPGMFENPAGDYLILRRNAILLPLTTQEPGDE